MSKDIKIVYNGCDISHNYEVLKCVHDMYSEDQADTLSIRLKDNDNIWSKWAPVEGDTVEVTCSFGKTGLMYVNKVTPEHGYINFKAGVIRRTEMSNNQKSWEAVHFKQICAEIAERHGLSVEYYGVKDQVYKYLNQENIDDFKFLNERCRLEGCSFVVYNGKLVVFSYEYLESQASNHLVTVSNNNRLSIKDGESYSSATITNGSVEGVYSSGTGKAYSENVNSAIATTAEANRYAKNILRRVNFNKRIGEFYSPNYCLTELSAASVINLRADIAFYSGKVFISHLRHDYRNGYSKVWFREVSN